MKGSVFENLPALAKVFLSENDCIDKDFRSELYSEFVKDISENIRDLPRTVNETCGIDRTDTQIECEKIFKHSYHEYLYEKTCEMKTYTVIKDIDYVLSDPFSNTIWKMDLSDNQNIEFLPISPSDKFPNLQQYLASRCVIREIFKINFENLRQISLIDLQGNQIFAVLSNTFEGLENLQTLDLSKS